MNCHISEISRFVDLQPVVKEILSYITDLNDFARKINNFTVAKDSLSVTMDVKSLHTSILYHEGMAAVKKRYEKFSNKIKLTKIKTIFFTFCTYPYIE